MKGRDEKEDNLRQQRMTKVVGCRSGVTALLSFRSILLQTVPYSSIIKRSSYRFRYVTFSSELLCDFSFRCSVS